MINNAACKRISGRIAEYRANNHEMPRIGEVLAMISNDISKPERAARELETLLTYWANSKDQDYSHETFCLALDLAHEYYFSSLRMNEIRGAWDTLNRELGDSE